jgi:hypothetical protein
MSNFTFNRGKYLIGTVDATATTWRVMLLTTSFTSDDGLNTVDDGTTSDPATYEITVGGYSRQVLALSAFEDDTNDIAGLDGADKTFASLSAGQTIGWAVVYRYSTSGGTTSDTGQDLLAAYQLTATPTNGGDVTVQWASTSAGGVLALRTTS